MKSRLKRTLAVLLALIIVYQPMPVSIFANEVFAAESDDVYTEDFSSQDLTGWEKDLGAGRFEVVNEQLEMETDGWVAGSIDFMQYYNSKAPKHKNARLAMDINVKNTHGRFGIVYRHIDSQNYDYVGYDVGGKWVRAEVRNGKKTETPLPISLNVDNKQIRFTLEYVNENIAVYVDDTELYNGPHTNNDEGHFGLRTWGYTDNYAFIQVDNIKYEKLRENEQTEDGHYLVSFKDEEHTGGWTKLSGDGTLEYTDQAMNFAADGNTIYADNYSPNMENGFVEFDFTPKTSGRMGFLFRLNGANDFAGFGYDGNGVWNYITGNDGWGPAGTKSLTVGEKSTVRIEFINDSYRLTVDGDEIFNGPIDAFDVKPGKAGIRTWGYGSGDTQGQLDVHRMVMGDFAGVTLSPSSVVVRSGEAGLYDLNIRISETNNTLLKVTHDGNELEANADYVLNEAETRLTLKKDFISSLQGEADVKTKIILEYEDGYKAEFALTILATPEVNAELYVNDFTENIDGMKVVSGNGTVEHKNGLDIINGQNLIVIDENAPQYKNAEVEFMFDPKNDAGNFAIVLRYNGPDDWVALGQNGSGGNSTSWNLFTSSGQNKQLTQDGNRIYAKRMEPYKVKARLVENVATIYLDNAEIYTGELSGISNEAGNVGLRYYGGSGANVSYLSVKEAKFPTRVTSEVDSVDIQSDELIVNVDKDFPAVNYYTLDGETIIGQANKVHEVEVNNTMYTPVVTSEVSGNQITYSMNIAEIDVSFDVVLTVENNVLDLRITDIVENGQTVYTINFPEHSLVSMDGNEDNATLTVNNYRDEKNLSLANVEAENTYEETSIAVLSSDKIAASIANGSIKRRNEVAYQTFMQDGTTSTGIWTNEYLYRGLDGEVIEEPWTKVAITLDRNGDGKVDTIDGAIAYRDDIAADLVGSDTVMQAYNSIAMNVGSNAQYPFLRILDNIKKFNLGTDGFKQNIIIKGYQSEGHDASTGDFNNFSDRAGGLEDFLVLLENAADNNATIGVHINQTEIYPESAHYGDYIVSSVPGWSWYDSAYQIIRENDLLVEEQGMVERLQDLDQSTNGLLEMIYVDVFFDTRWPAHKMADALNDKLGIALGTEYVDEFTKDSVWAHHIDSRYNTAGNLVRVIHNNDKDIFGNQALFRDASTRNVGINGWQNSVDYNKSIKGFFTQVLPNKYLAQYPIMNYETTNKAVLGHKQNVVTEMIGGVNHILQDGKKVAEGNDIFIPWTNDGEEEKIYAWTDSGAAKTWELPDGWENESTVQLFKVSDQGRELVEKISVNGGKVTLNLEKETGYTIYKGSSTVGEKSSADVDWTEGSVVKDAGFNSHAFNDWQLDAGKASFQNNNIGNTHLIIEGEEQGIVSQKLTGLEVGESYGASVWAEVENGKRAIIRITDGDEVYENYIDKSDVIYGVKHTDKNNTYQQRMGVNFVAKNDTVLLELIGEESAANGKADFNDVRVRKMAQSDQKGHTFLEDFENVDEGFGPFVSTGSDNSHLSEKNEPHTKDTIDGRYSLKIRYGDHMRTLPQTMRLEPNTYYTLSLDYLAYQEGVFNASIKSDDGDETLVSEAAKIHSDPDAPGTIVLEFTTGEYEDYYLDISPAKGGQGEYILDNLILDGEVNKKALIEKLAEIEKAALVEEDYTDESWEVLAAALEAAEAVVANEEATQEEVNDALKALEEAFAALEEVNGIDKTVLENIIAEAETYVEADYTSESWAAFATALATAETVVADDEATQEEVDAALVALEDAMDALEEVTDPADTTELEEAIEEIEALELVEGDYAAASWAVFASAWDAALAVLNDDRATEGDIAEALQALEDAMRELAENVEPANTEALEETLGELEALALDEADYTPESWAVFVSAWEAALAILENDEVKQSEVDKALGALQDAREGLQSADVPTDSTALTDLVNEIKELELVETDYTAASWSNFTEALEVAEEVLAKEKPTQAEVDKALETLKTALDELKDAANKEALADKVAEVEALDLVETDFTAESWDIFADALDVANVVLADGDATQTAVDEALAALEAAFTGLKDAVDTKALAEAVAKIESLDLDEADYTEESWKAFAEALAAANAILTNSDATQTDVDEALASLDAAFTGLAKAEEPEESSVDKDALVEKVEALDDAQIVGKDYTSESWDAYVKALNAAKAVVADEDATQADVDAALAALTKAYDGLEKAEEPGGEGPGEEPGGEKPGEGPGEKPSEKPVNKDALLNEIAQLQEAKLAGDDYTASSWKTYVVALEAAQVIAEKADATQAEVDEALAALQAAYEGLINAGEPEEEPNEPEQPEQIEKPDGNDLPKTATNMFNWLALGLLIIIAGVGLFVFRKNKTTSN